MTVTAAVAAGDQAVADLRRAWSGRLDADEAALVSHRGLAVAWSTRCPWIATHDNGDLLVVIDGRLHDLAPLGSQAEAVAARYSRFGRDVARGLTGDFVLVILQRSTGSVLVARDPLGVRPWYQASRGARHAGASEVATLVSLPWVDREVDERTAIEYLAAMNTSTGRTFHRGISTLAPGTTWIHAQGSVRSHRHHQWDLVPDLETTWDEAVERCRHELDAAVARRLAVMGPATSELSGGLDSSSVVGTIMGLGVEDLVVGRLVFDGPRADEREWSDAVIGHWNVPAVSVPPWIPDPEQAVDLTAKLARPLPDPHFLMFAGLRSTLAATGRPDLLTGLGGDDAFVSPGMGTVVISAAQLRQWPVLGRVARATALHPRSAWQNLHRPALHHLAWWRGARLPSWVSADAVTQGDLRRSFRQRAPKITGIAAIDERITNLSLGYDAAVLETQAVVADLVGARASHPFLDPRFIEATYGLDPTWPTRDDHSRALQVAAYCDRLPRSVAERRTKADFSEAFWPQVLADNTVADLARGPLMGRGWLDLPAVDALVRRAELGAPNTAIPLARCRSLDRWLGRC